MPFHKLTYILLIGVLAHVSILSLRFGTRYGYCYNRLWTSTDCAGLFILSNDIFKTCINLFIFVIFELEMFGKMNNDVMSSACSESRGRPHTIITIAVTRAKP